MLFDRTLVSLEVFFFCPGRNYKIEDELQKKYEVNYERESP